jgi:hypothetical protein
MANGPTRVCGGNAGIDQTRRSPEEVVREPTGVVKASIPGNPEAVRDAPLTSSVDGFRMTRLYVRTPGSVSIPQPCSSRLSAAACVTVATGGGEAWGAAGAIERGTHAPIATAADDTTKNKIFRLDRPCREFIARDSLS